MTQHSIFTIAASVLLALATPVARADDSVSPRPNFVIILADDLGYADVGCYGSTRIRTPNIDKLAAEGLRFTDFHSSGPVCSPTRAGLLTGRYQQRAGVPGVINADPKVNRHHGLQLAETTFAELLRPAGYRTAIFGKWHLGYERQYNPCKQGFDEFRGYVSGNVDYVSHLDRMGIFDWWQNEKLEDEPGYTTHLITRHAVEFVEKNRERPFCLYVAHEAPHSPYQGPKDPAIRGPGKKTARGGKKDVPRAYREMVEALDEGVGKVVQAVRRAGIEKRTLVVFVSDNGANRNGSNGPLRGFKGSLWEGGHRVPGIAWWPGRITAGRTCHETTISIDIFPTMLELAGVKRPDKLALDGSSLVPLLDGAESLPARTLFWQFGRASVVRRGPWKLMVSGGRAAARPQLFHLARDLGETKDVAKEHPERVAELTRALEAWQEDVSSGATEQPGRAR